MYVYVNEIKVYFKLMALDVDFIYINDNNNKTTESFDFKSFIYIKFEKLRKILDNKTY